MLQILSEFPEKFDFSGFFYKFAEIFKNNKKMKNYRIFYLPQDSKKEACAIIPATCVKQALTRFNAAGFSGVIHCVQDTEFDSNLFNF